MARHVLLLATLDTKAAEAGFLSDRLADLGVPVQAVDLSLDQTGQAPTGKLALMEAAAARARAQLAATCDPETAVVVGLGGGTGSQVILKAMRDLPVTLPKVLITTLPFDPRDALADSSIILVPTLADIEGLNDILRQTFDRAACMIRGLVDAVPLDSSARAIGITALGVTQPASAALCRRLSVAGFEPTVFHANGYGGAAFARFVSAGAFEGVIDMTVHEITRLHLAGAHVPMPTRFSCAADLPRVVLPGGLNFLGLGALDTVPESLRNRPIFRHSQLFTHVQLSVEEMARAALLLAGELNAAHAPVDVILPMGGFSSEDRPGGALASPELREVAATTLERAARHYRTRRLDSHINDPETAEVAVAALLEHLP